VILQEDGNSPAAKWNQIKEELDADITVGELVETVQYDYPAFHLTMHCFLCAVDPVFFVGYECSAHCFCLPIVAADFDN